MLRVELEDLRWAFWRAFQHNALLISKAAAYSALLSLFPALLVVAELLGAVPGIGNVRGDVRSMLTDVLPADTMNVAQHYFESKTVHSHRLVISAGVVAVGAAVGFMLSLMEGFRRAYRLPRGGFGFWRERAVAIALLPSTLVPMTFATAFVVFGHQIELWGVDRADHQLRPLVLLLWRCARWLVASSASVCVLAVVYHYGSSVRPRWRNVLPGATLATVMWFASTMVYGWYVTRFADYSIVYGPLGAGIATMVWLYIVSLAVLIGAEFNAQKHPVVGLGGMDRALLQDEAAGEVTTARTAPKPTQEQAARQGQEPAAHLSPVL